MRFILPVAFPLVATWALLAAPVPVPAEKPKADAGTFLVQQVGLAYLDGEGREKERLGADATIGAWSPDGSTLAHLRYDKDLLASKLVLRPRDGGAAVVVDEVTVAVGEGCLPVWSADGRRLVVGQNRNNGGVLESSHHVYDLAAKKLSGLNLPGGHTVTGWSKDGKHLLTTFRSGDGARVCRIDAAGKGEPEFLTAADETAVDAKPSPDGKRILFLAAKKAKASEPLRYRLYSVDLATKTRTAVGEPGEVGGYCWSLDGSRIAYTWQRTPVRGDENAERETFLITCDAAGRNVRRVTSRKYKPTSPGLHVTRFFEVIDWR